MYFFQVVPGSIYARSVDDDAFLVLVLPSHPLLRLSPSFASSSSINVEQPSSSKEFSNLQDMLSSGPSGSPAELCGRAFLQRMSGSASILFSEASASSSASSTSTSDSSILMFGISRCALSACHRVFITQHVSAPLQHLLWNFGRNSLSHFNQFLSSSNSLSSSSMTHSASTSDPVILPHINQLPVVVSSNFQLPSQTPTASSQVAKNSWSPALNTAAARFEAHLHCLHARNLVSAIYLSMLAQV